MDMPVRKVANGIGSLALMVFARMTRAQNTVDPSNAFFEGSGYQLTQIRGLFLVAIVIALGLWASWVIIGLGKEYGDRSDQRVLWGNIVKVFGICILVVAVLWMGR